LQVTEREDMQKKRVAVNGTEIDVRENVHPLYRPLIMVHGIGVSGTYFLPLAEELSRDYSVFILDLPGYGETPKPPKPLSISELAYVVDEFIELYKLRRPVLIGQSMGCQVVMELTKKKTGKYEEVVLVGPTANTKERNHFIQAWRLLQDTFLEPFKLNLIIFSDYLRMGAGRYLVTSKSMITNRIESNIKKYTGRVLVIRGENDKISPRDWCRHLVNISSRGSSIEIPGAAHVAQYTKPKELGDACRNFLQS
jgi:pimeloyl-ACP methyl ester carboxylesterase